MTKEKIEIIIEILKTRLQFRELNGNQKHGYGLALQEIQEQLNQSELKPQQQHRILIKRKSSKVPITHANILTH